MSGSGKWEYEWKSGFAFLSLIRQRKYELIMTFCMGPIFRQARKWKVNELVSCKKPHLGWETSQPGLEGSKLLSGGACPTVETRIGRVETLGELI
jgi:hypothetical protein